MATGGILQKRASDQDVKSHYTQLLNRLKFFLAQICA